MSETVTEKVTEDVLPDAVTETADSAAEPESEAPAVEASPEPGEPWKEPLTALENRVSELTEAVAGLASRVPAPEVVAPDEPTHDTKPVRQPWTSRGFKRRNVVE
jgi:hypothetical protein